MFKCDKKHNPPFGNRDKLASFIKFVVDEIRSTLEYPAITVPDWVGKDLYNPNDLRQESSAHIDYLCDLITSLLPHQLELIVYNAHNKTSRQLADWWENHLEAAARRIEEDRSKNKALLVIDNCLDCPHHKMLPDPGYDSFDMSDEGCVCTHPNAPRKKCERVGTEVDRSEFKAIFRGERSSAKQCQAAKIPNWCPILQKG